MIGKFQNMLADFYRDQLKDDIEYDQDEKSAIEDFAEWLDEVLEE